MESVIKQIFNIDISNEYKIYEFMNGKIRQRIRDGYFSATDICKIGNKQFNDFSRLDKSKEYLQILEYQLNKDSNKKIILIEVIKGGNIYKQGSMIHPIAATYLAMWISPKFSVKVTLWINEWKQNHNNTIIYNNELCVLESSSSDKKEKELQLKLAKELNAEIEVKTPAGYIDLLNFDSIIEIKEFSLWKNALGQILSYSIYYPLKEKVIYLFGDIIENKIDMIKETYSKYNIKLVLIKLN